MLIVHTFQTGWGEFGVAGGTFESYQPFIRQLFGGDISECPTHPTPKNKTDGEGKTLILGSLELYNIPGHLYLCQWWRVRLQHKRLLDCHHLVPWYAAFAVSWLANQVAKAKWRWMGWLTSLRTPFMALNMQKMITKYLIDFSDWTLHGR